jgi:hypothetical protein
MNVEIGTVWPHNSFSGNICFEFSVLSLCSESCCKDLAGSAVLEFLEHSMGARNRVGIGISYRTARLHRLAGRYGSYSVPIYFTLV